MNESITRVLVTINQGGCPIEGASIQRRENETQVLPRIRCEMKERKKWRGVERNGRKRHGGAAQRRCDLEKRVVWTANVDVEP